LLAATNQSQHPVSQALPETNATRCDIGAGSSSSSCAGYSGWVALPPDDVTSSPNVALEIRLGGLLQPRFLYLLFINKAQLLLSLPTVFGQTPAVKLNTLCSFDVLPTYKLLTDVLRQFSALNPSGN